jgi:ubiquitin C-terminal hydrolase
MQTIWSTNEINTSIAPIDLVQTIKYINPMFKGYAQHDSQEFLLTLLDQLHEELKRLSSTNNNNNNDSILTSPTAIASKQSDVKLFQIQLKHFNIYLYQFQQKNIFK